MVPLARSANWKGVEAIRVVAHGDHGIPELDRLADCPHLSGVRILDLNDDSQASYWDVLFVAEGAWKNLRRLDWNAWVDDRSVGAICEGTATGELRYLRLSNKVGGSGATGILTADHLKHLVVIDLHGNMIRNLKRSAFTKAQRPNLRVLNLGGANGARWRGSKDFTKADLMTVTTSPITHQLQILDISGNGLTDAATKPFFRAMQMLRLTMLSLSHNQKLGPATASAIATCGQLRNLQSLDLMWTKIGDTGAKALAKSKHLGKLRYLDVSQAGVTAAGLSALRKRFGEDVVRA